MAGLNTGIRLKKEAKTSLQAYKDQSLLRRRFGDDAVKLYDRIGTGKPASQLISELDMAEERLVEIIEFMNNNAMVSVTDGGSDSIGQISAKPQEDKGQEEGSSETSGQEDTGQAEEPEGQGEPAEGEPPRGGA